MSYTDYDYSRYGHYFADKWQFDRFMRKVENAHYQLLADIETTRIELLNTSLSRANHWYVVLCIDDNRSHVKALYGPFLSPALAMAELRTVESFVAKHATKYAAFSYCEIAALPYCAVGLWNSQINQFKSGDIVTR